MSDRHQPSETPTAPWPARLALPAPGRRRARPTVPGLFTPAAPRGLAAGLLCALLAPVPSMPAQPTASYQRALELRSQIDATLVHLRTEGQYLQALNAFRAVYHADRTSPDAAASVEAVAELLANEGRDFHHPSLLAAAVQQLEFLRRDYPASPYASSALMTEGEIEDRDLHNATAARAYFTSFLATGGTSSLMPEARAELRRLGGSPAPASTSASTSASTASLSAADHAQAAPVETAPATEYGVVDGVPVRRAAAAPGHGMAQVSDIRQWSTANYTRIAIDVTHEVPFEASRVAGPDRVFFDLHGAQLAPSLAGHAVTVADGGFLERIRAAQFSNDVVRVVLDVSNVSDYSAFWLQNPARLIIDIHGRPANAPPITYAQAAQPAQTAPAPVRTRMTERDLSQPRTAVTQAASAASAAGMPTPRGARPSAPDTFVANTATTSTRTEQRQGSGDSVAAIAALSRQPTQVRATPAPTTAPVAALVDPAGIEPATGVTTPARMRRGRRHVQVQDAAASASAPVAAPVPETPGEMARAAAPDSDGSRSMVRALGLKINRIVIDPGHGGHDSGTLGPGGIEEKDVVLDVALKLGKLLKERLGADVIYTRDTDVFIPLETRTAIANKDEADLFISIHANSSSDPSARGVETYYLNFTSNPDALETAARENAVSDESIHQLSSLVKQITLTDKIEESREFAADVQSSLYQGLEAGNPGLKDRGVKKAPFVVLIGANMPSILAEISFLTNPDDAAELRQGAYQERIAKSLYRGIARYIQSLSSAASQETAAR